MAGIFIGVVLAVACVVAFVAGLWLWLRHHAFRQLLRYDPVRRQSYALERFGGQSLDVLCCADGFDLPRFGRSVTAAFLPLEVTATLTGKFCDPWIEMTAGEVTRRQYFERGARGTRHLNLSGLFTDAVPPMGRVQLHGGHLQWRKSQRTHAFAFSEHLAPSEKVVVVAAHPDDAEIGAFGVYSSTDAVVVTVTAGDATDGFGSPAGGGLLIARATVAKTRVWDSIIVPQCGGVPPERAVNLAYPDGELAAMFAKPDCEFNARAADGVDFAALRALNLSPLVPRERLPCSWRSLVGDLTRIFTEVKPAGIVTPFPVLDPHSDHGFTTVAVAEAAAAAGLSETRVLLCVVHNRGSELYPFGPAGSDVSLPPLFDASDVECDGLCVVPLSDGQQQGKLLALEAMHDLRQVRASSAVDWRAALNCCRAQIVASLHGLGLPPTSFLRRAVRPQELFFVVRPGRLTRLVEGFTRASR